MEWKSEKTNANMTAATYRGGRTNSIGSISSEFLVGTISSEVSFNAERPARRCGSRRSHHGLDIGKLQVIVAKFAFAKVKRLPLVLLDRGRAIRKLYTITAALAALGRNTQFFALARESATRSPAPEIAAVSTTLP